MTPPARPLAVVGSLRRDDGTPVRFVTALAETWVRGVAVDWTSLFEGAQVVDVPTYAFERDHYWPKAKAAVLDADGLGLVGARHPLLGAGVVLAGSDGVVFTGRLGVTTHPWLADHVVLGSVVVPGTALVELALRAGDEVGCARLDELVVEAPLMLPETAGIGVQVEVGDPDETGRRPVAIHARRGDDEPWTRHASGTLSPAIFQSPESSSWAQAWPPSQAVEVDLNRLYDELAGTGLVYGPVFRGLRRAWRDGEVVYAEVSLPDEATDVERFILHPALFDAALHAIGICPVRVSGASRTVALLVGGRDGRSHGGQGVAGSPGALRRWGVVGGNRRGWPRSGVGGVLGAAGGIGGGTEGEEHRVALRGRMGRAADPFRCSRRLGGPR